MLLSFMQKSHLEILKKSTILLVDDNVELRKKFRNTLYSYVDTILEASNGEEAFELYQTKNPNIVITDVKMPVMDGMILTTLIRKLNSEIPIVIISAYSEKNMLLDFMSLNLVQYLVKPIDFNDLVSVLERCAKIILDKGLIEFELAKSTIYSFSKKSLLVSGEIVTLTPKEILLVELLINNKNKLVSKEHIEDIIYNGEVMSDSALNNLLLKIRKKIGLPRLITTVSNYGFMLVKQ